MTDYHAKLVYKVGSLYSLLRELAAASALQGEHAIAYTAPDGTAQTLYAYVDGTNFELSREHGNRTGLSLNSRASED